MKQSSPVLDRVGACASAFCAVHCILTGVALGLLSSLGLGFFDHPLIDLLFFGVAIGVGIFAFRHGIRKHKSYVPALFFVLGILLFALSHGLSHDVHSHAVWQTVLNVCGGTCLVLFHFLNVRLQRARTCCGEGKICTHGEKPPRLAG